MDASNHDERFNLLAKYFAGEAEPEEAVWIDNWLSDPENKKEFDRLFLLWNKVTLSAEPLNTPDKSKSWHAVQQQISKPRAVGILSRRAIVYFAAASFIGILLIAMFVWQKSAPVPINETVSIESQQIKLQAVSSDIQDTLPDKSVVNVRHGSVITFPADFSQVKRDLSLTGEAYFNVTPDASKPFVIRAGALTIQVIGTSFNVRSIDSNQTIEVQVQSGVVKMHVPGAEIKVVKGQTGIYHITSRQLQLDQAIDINELAYATHTFAFNDLSLRQACNYLQKGFGVKIEMDENKFRDCKLTAGFQNKSLQYILEVLDATFNITHTMKGNTIYINGDGCQ